MAISVFQPAADKTAMTSVSLAIFCPALGLITRQALLHFIKTLLFLRHGPLCDISRDKKQKSFRMRLPGHTGDGFQHTTNNTPQENKPEPCATVASACFATRD